MSIVLKTGTFVAALGALLAILPQQAQAGDPFYCRQQYQYCLSVGVDPDICRDEYYYCRYGYYPMRGAAAPAPMVGRD